MRRTWLKNGRAGRIAGIARTLGGSALLVAMVNAAAPLPSSAATLDQVRETGKLTLGYRTDAPPFSFKDDAGKPAGYSVALCQLVADHVKAKLGLPSLAVEWTPVTLDG